MTFPLDNKKSEYTWNAKWIHPYESAWNICEKFRAANVTDASQNLVLGIKSNGVKANFSDGLDVYVRGTHNGILENMQENNLSIIQKKWILIDPKIRYCPECLLNGYHSVYHQPNFLTSCFIHDPLQYLCECEYSYILEWKGSTDKAFQCKCKTILPIGNIADGICDVWKKDFVLPKLIKPKGIKSISILDFNLYFTNMKSKLSDLQSNILECIILNKQITTEIHPIFTTKRGLEKKSRIQQFAAKYLEVQLIEKYEIEKYEWHFYQLSTRNQDYPNVDKYIHELSAGLFLINELLSLNHIDQIYLNRVPLMSYEKDSMYNEYIATINHFVVYTNNKEQLSKDLFTFLYSELLFIRYKHILTELQKGLLPAYQQIGKYLPHANIYPVYIIIEYTNGNIDLY